jgi:hypothetical protein
MSSTFKNASGTATTNGVALYTVPANTTAIVIGIVLCNKTSSQVTATVAIGSTNLVYQVPIPAGSSFSPLDGKVVLTAAQAMTVTASANSAIDTFISVLEQA